MTTTIDREALAARVRKLSKMTTENGCSETEAAFAAQRIAEIMAAHALTQDELSLKADAAHCIQDEFIIFGQDFGDWPSLQASIARLYGTKPWVSKVRLEEIEDLGISHPVRPFVFYGMPYDVVACISTMSICYSAVSSAAEGERRKRADFASGMVARLCQRVNLLRPKFTTGTALISLKDQLVTDEFAKLNIRLRGIRRAVRIADPQAYAKGFAAGASVNLTGGANATTRAPQQALLKPFDRGDYD